MANGRYLVPVPGGKLRTQPSIPLPIRLAPSARCPSRGGRHGRRLRQRSFLALFQDRKWSLHGSDLSPSGIAVARETFPNIDFFLADGQNLYADFLATVGPVDVVLSTEVIEHVYDPRAFLRNCYELLKPGGILVLTTPYHGYLKNLMLALTGRMDRHFTVLWDHGHIKFWSRRTLSQALTEAGFTDIEFTGSGRLPYLWKSMVLKAAKPS